MALLRLSRIVIIAICVFFMDAAFLHAGPDTPSYEVLRKKYTPQATPQASFQLEAELLSQGIYCYALPLFDPVWQRKGRQILYDPRYKKTAEEVNLPFKERREGDYAIIYFPFNTNVGPVFLYRDKNTSGWILHRSAVWNYIHYNHTNTGWFAYEGNYPYLGMLARAFSMRRVRLENGVWAYQIRE